MKCDNLKVRTVYVDWKGGDICYYDPNEVDAAIDELKTEHHKERHEYIEMVAQLRRENAELKAQVNGFKNRSNLWEYNAQNEHNAAVAVRMENAKLKKKLEDAKATHYAESVDAGMRERRLRRALWIAHAYKAKFKRWWLHLALDCEASMIRPDTKTIKRIRGKIRNCEKSERKCRAKAEEYK